MGLLPSSTISALKCRLRFAVCAAAGSALAVYGLGRWSPLSEFVVRGPIADPALATLDFGAAAAFFLAGPAFLIGWKHRGGPRREPQSGESVVALFSLLAGGLFSLFFLGASIGLVRALLSMSAEP